MEEKVYSEILSAAPFLRETVVKFIETIPARISEMETALAQGKQEELRVMAHRLKGTGGTHGYPSLSERARTLEAAIKQNDMELAKSLLADLRTVIPRLVPDPPPKKS